MNEGDGLLTQINQISYAGSNLYVLNERMTVQSNAGKIYVFYFISTQTANNLLVLNTSNFAVLGNYI